MANQKWILIVDDDERICKLVSLYLQKEGYQTSYSLSGEHMWSTLSETDQQPDMIILDLMLPDDDGISLARQLRQNLDVPIIILSAKDSPIEKVVGLEVGADDYLTKPFDERELLARIRSVMRRTNTGRSRSDRQIMPDSDVSDESVLRFEGWTLNLKQHTLHNPAGHEVYLTSHEFSLLEAFVTRPNCVLTRDTLLNLLCGRGHEPFDRSIDVLIGKLRKKLEADIKQPKLIKTIRGRGYIFVGARDVGL